MLTLCPDFFPQVTHRKLAARNVMVCKVPTGLVAKVIGYGPMKGEEEGESAKDHKVCSVYYSH